MAQPDRQREAEAAALLLQQMVTGRQ